MNSEFISVECSSNEQQCSDTKNIISNSSNEEHCPNDTIEVMNSPVENITSNVQHRSNETNTNSNSKNVQNITSKHINYVDETSMSFSSRTLLCLYKKSSTRGAVMFAVFTSIVMIVAVLIICLTTPKPSNECQMTFRRTMKSSIVYSSEPRSGAVGYLNKDNKLDIIVTNSGTNTIDIFISDINGTFTNLQTCSTGSESSPYTVVINDFNNDNYRDIAVANYGTHNIGIFFGYGNGTFGNQKVFSTGSFRPFFIATGDFNKDNQPDLVIIYYGTDNIGILLGNGDGTFQDATMYSTGYDSLPYSLAIGDLNKDNQLDIVVANNGTNNIGIFLGNHNGTFINQKTYATGRNSYPSFVAIGDFNGDNEQDIVVANYGIGNVGIFLNHNNGNFAEQITYSTGSNSHPESVAVGYFDRDNYLDVVVFDSSNDKIHVLSGYGNGSFSSLVTYDTMIDSRPLLIAVADVVSDNQSDIIIANYNTNNILVLSGYSSKPAVRQTIYSVGRKSLPPTVVIYDLNNDGKLDLVTSNYNNDYILILNGIGGNGGFVRGETYSTGNKSASQNLCLGDVNNDTRMDIVIANTGANSVGILFGQNNGTFSVLTTYSTGNNSTPWSVILSDLNNDKRLDIITANYGTGTVGILFGYGNGMFSDVTTYSTGIGSLPYMVDIGDVNNDSYLDIAVSNSAPGHVGVLLNYGNGTFAPIRTYTTGFISPCVHVVLVDVNSDKCLDIVITIPFAGIIMGIFGDGKGNFDEYIIYSNRLGTLPFHFTVVNFNQDSYYDMVVANYGTNEILIFYGDLYGNFNLARTYSTGEGTNPFSSIVADSNNDTHLDIIVTYRGAGNVAILTEYYAAEFSHDITYLTSSAPRPTSVAVGDFNNDSRIDIVVANSGTSNLSIYFGPNHGTFSTQMIYPLEIDSNPQYVLASDINEDGHIDIITVNANSDTMSIILGHGNGTFDNQLTYSTGTYSYPCAIALGRFNSDYQQDIVIANRDADNIGIFLAFDYVIVQNLHTYLIENTVNPYTIVASDFNNDKHLDIAVAFINSDNFAVLLGDGNGNFTVMSTYSTGDQSSPTMLAVRDVNNDNRMDIIVVNAAADNIGVFLGNGNGSFNNMISYSTGNGSNPRVLAFGDFNNDNRTDIVTVNAPQNTIGILLGDNNGRFTLTKTFSTGFSSRPQSVAVNDLNNDGQLDIAVVNSFTSTMGIFLGRGNGSFATQITFSTGLQSNPIWLGIGDFNGDNRSDVAVANYFINTIGIFIGYGNGSFATITTYSSGDGSVPVYLTIVDFNGDNISDIVIANFAGSNVVVLYGLGDGTFLLGNAYSTGTQSSPQSLAIGDFDNNTQLDIVVANYQSNTVGVFLAKGHDVIGGMTKYPTGDESEPHSVAVGDVNNDGWLDIVVANFGTDNIGILLGRGNGKFNPITTYPTGTGSAPYFVAIGHFNNSNQSDIVVSKSRTYNIAVLSGYSNGTFTTVTTYSTGARSRPYTITIADLNNDNKSDLVIVNFGTHTIFVLYGYGNGTFGNSTPFALGYGFQPQSAAVADLNQDNLMDIVVACYSTDHIETLVQMC